MPTPEQTTSESFAVRQIHVKTAASILALVEEGTPVVRRLAANAYRDSVLDHDDLIQEGFVGLMEAAHRYDETGKTPFASYAYSRIGGSMIDAVRSLSPVERPMQQLIARAESAEEVLAQVLQRMPTKEELRGRLGLSEAEFCDLQKARQRKKPLESLNKRRHADRRDSLEERLPDSSADIDDIVFAEEEALAKARFAKDTIDRALKVLDTRRRRIVKEYHFKGRTQLEIARKLGVSEVMISKLRRSALDQMRDYLERAA